MMIDSNDSFRQAVTSGQKHRHPLWGVYGFTVVHEVFHLRPRAGYPQAECFNAWMEVLNAWSMEDSLRKLMEGTTL